MEKFKWNPGAAGHWLEKQYQQAERVLKPNKLWE